MLPQNNQQESVTSNKLLLGLNNNDTADVNNHIIDGYNMVGNSYIQPVQMNNIPVQHEGGCEEKVQEVNMCSNHNNVDSNNNVGYNNRYRDLEQYNNDFGHGYHDTHSLNNFYDYYNGNYNNNYAQYGQYGQYNQYGQYGYGEHCNNGYLNGYYNNDNNNSQQQQKVSNVSNVSNVSGVSAVSDVSSVSTNSNKSTETIKGTADIIHNNVNINMKKVDVSGYYAIADMCSVCWAKDCRYPVWFKDWKDMVNHFKRFHTDLFKRPAVARKNYKPKHIYQCDECMTTVANWRELFNHKYTSCKGEQAQRHWKCDPIFTCMICKDGFGLKGLVEKHLRTVHKKDIIKALNS